MLNTNQSIQKKSLKYVLILPFLCVFMLFFQLETLAQVKEQNKTKVNEKKDDFETENLNPKKSKEAKYLTFDNGDQLVYYDKTLKIPGEPALKINTYIIYIDDVKIDADKFIKIETLNYKKYKYNKRGNILKLYSK